METKQTIKLNMLIAVRDYLAQYLRILNALPGFVEFYEKLQNIILEIQKNSVLQGRNKTGATKNKKQLKENLINLAADTARKTAAYAKLNNLTDLLEEMSVSISDLRNLSDVGLRDEAQRIYERTQENLSNLTAYGITEESQAALKTAIDDFEGSKSQPRVNLVETTMATQLLSESVKTGDDIIDNIDAIMEIIRTGQPSIYKGYKSARKQVKTGSGKLDVKGKVIDAITKAGLRGAKVTLVSVDDPSVVIEKITAQQGGFQINNLNEGIYTITVNLPGYKTVTTSVTVVDGQMSSLTIEMVKE